MVYEPNRLVTITEYAEHWKLSRTTVYSLIKENKIQRYLVEDKKGHVSIFLCITEHPGAVQPYGDKKRKGNVKRYKETSSGEEPTE